VSSSRNLGTCPSVIRYIFRTQGANFLIDSIQYRSSPLSEKRDGLRPTGIAVIDQLFSFRIDSDRFWACTGSLPSTQVITASIGSLSSECGIFGSLRLDSFMLLIPFHCIFSLAERMNSNAWIS